MNMKMTKLLLFKLFLSLPLLAQTTLSGRIDDLSINATNSPYLVTETITVPAGKTLKIGEGAVLLFKPFTGLVVEGTLLVEGTLENPVVFTTENDSKYNPASTQLPNPFDWNGIYITAKAELVKLSNFKLEYSVYGVKSQKEVFIINNGTFSRNGQFHVTVNDAIKNVAEDIPFNFGKEPEAKDGPGTKPAAERKAWKKPLGIGLGALGLAGIGAGGYLAYAGSRFTSQSNTAETKKESDAYLAKRNSALAGAGVCALVGAVSLVGGVVVYPWRSGAEKTKKLTIAPLLGRRSGILVAIEF
jgi:hypothetical protein